MAMLTVRNIPDDIHKALRLRAAEHGCSTEAEVRTILAAAVAPPQQVPMGEALAAIGRRLGLRNEDFQVFEELRDKTPAQPMSFP